MSAAIGVPVRFSLCAALLAALLSPLRADAPDSPAAVLEALQQSNVLLEAGRYPEAETALRQGLDMVRRLHLNDEWAAMFWNNFGTYYEDLGRCQEAEASFRHALRVWERTAYPLLVRTAVNLGSLLLGCGDLAGADRQWKTMLAPRIGQLPENDRDLAAALVFDGELLFAYGKYAAAEPVLERAHALWQRNAGPPDMHILLMWNALALVHSKVGRYDEAIGEGRQAVAVVEQVHGPVHPMLAKLYGNLSAVYYLAGRPQEAEQSCRKALSIATAAFGPGHPVTAGIMLTHAELLRKSRHKAEAEAEKRAARNILIESSRTQGRTVAASDFRRR